MSRTQHPFRNEFNTVLEEFIDTYPEVYLSKMQNYNGLRLSQPPHYQSHINGTEKGTFQTYSY
jgi:hypothetical protein